MYIYLDDERNPKISHPWVICRTGDEFKKAVRAWPNATKELLYISFDHDLGNDQPSGYDLMKWFCGWLLDHNMADEILEKVTVNVHSANPVGRKNINAYWDSFTKYLTDDPGE